MSILIIGEPSQLDDCKLKFEGIQVEYFLGEELEDKFLEYDIIFDLIWDIFPNKRLGFWESKKDGCLFLQSLRSDISTIMTEIQFSSSISVGGINSLPGQMNKNLWELSSPRVYDKTGIESFLQEQNFECKWVEDVVGMVSPRTLLMIINEAFFTIQENIASVEDIDKAMKYGTAYPKGPFEWVEKWGISNVYEILDSIHKKTGEPRYKPAQAMKKSYSSAMLNY